MSKRIDTKDLFRRREESRKLLAKMPIVEKLAIAEELRDLQKALAPAREANRLKVRKKRDQAAG
jgi:hypothetical protein